MKTQSQICGEVVIESMRRLRTSYLEKIEEEAGDEFPNLLLYNGLPLRRLIERHFAYWSKWN